MGVGEPWPRTRREREIVIKAHLKPFFTGPAGEIGVKEIELYKTSRDKAGIAGTTMNTELKTISCILRFGVELGYLLAMPKIRRVKISAKKPRHLSKEEIFKVLDAARPDRRPMLQLMIFTGQRKGELAHLEWSERRPAKVYQAVEETALAEGDEKWPGLSFDADVPGKYAGFREGET